MDEWIVLVATVKWATWKGEESRKQPIHVGGGLPSRHGVY